MPPSFEIRDATGSVDERALAVSQSRFAGALLDGESDIPQDVRAPSAVQQRQRFAVYRNNVYASLIETLRSRFPVIFRLAGEDLFRAIAREFIKGGPPRSPALLEYGEGFPAFLEGFEPIADHPFMADIARLEWLRAQAYHAADATPIVPAALQEMAPEHLGDIVITLHPSAGLITSPYPIVAIWETNTHDAEVRPIGPGEPGQDALVVRRGLEVIVVRLGPGAHAFIGALARREPLAAAAGIGASIDGFSLPQALAALIKTEAIVALKIDGARPDDPHRT